MIDRWGDDGEAGSLAVVALHGRGQDVAFVRGLADRIAVPEAAWFAPEAEGNTWYPYPFLDPAPENATALAQAIEEAAGAVTAARVAGHRRVAVLGFSQGACVLAHLLLTRELDVDAAVLFTGGYVGPTELDEFDTVSRVGTGVLLRSIDRDPWVPPHRVADTAKLLVRAGARVDALIEPGSEHGVTERAVADARALLHAQLEPARSSR